MPPWFPISAIAIIIISGIGGIITLAISNHHKRQWNASRKSMPRRPIPTAPLFDGVSMPTPTLQNIIVASFMKQAGRAHTDVDPLVDGKIFLTGTFDINAIVAEIEMWALGGQVGMDKIRELLTKSNAG